MFHLKTRIQSEHAIIILGVPIVNKIYSQIKFSVILLLLWLLVNGEINLNTLLIGFFGSFTVTYFSYDLLLDRKGKHFKSIPVSKLLRYFLSLFVEIFKSAYVFSINVFKKEFVPTVFKISLEHLDPVRVAIVANSITLTPGTISIEIVDQSIYVMVLAKPGASIESLEKPIREHFEKLLDTEKN